MKLNTQDNLVIEDAAKCYKSTFVSLYTGLGYDQKEVSEAWHGIRTTSKGRFIMDKFKLKPGQAARMYNIEEEIKERKQALNKTNMKSRSAQQALVTKQSEVNLIKEEFLPEDEIDVMKLKVAIKEEKEADIEMLTAKVTVKKEVKNEDGTKNNKEAAAKYLIESGVTKAKELSEKGGFSLPYAYNMLKKYGK